MYLLNVYSIFKVREVFALTNQLGNFFRFVRSFFEIFQKNFFDHLSGIKKAPITSRECNRGRNSKSPLTEISGLKLYERVVVYRDLSAIGESGTHFWRIRLLFVICLIIEEKGRRIAPSPLFNFTGYLRLFDYFSSAIDD